MHGRRWLPALLAVIAACSGSGTQSASTTAPAATTTTLPAYEPVYAKGPCNDEVPTDPRIECGSLTVPLDRRAPDGAKVVLPVAVVHPPAGTTAQPDPVVYFSGGPGFPGLTIAGGFLHNDWVTDRDVILFDQRGTGEATPSLDCPAATAGVLAALGAAAPPADERAAASAVISKCHDDLVAAGVDLSQFTTTATADDVADLKRALGVDTWNLFGVSYGTTVALEVVRRHPEGVRSMVIDSVYPTTVASDGDHQADVVHRALKVLFDGCSIDAACNRAYPDLSNQLDTLVADWNAKPFEADVTGDDGESHHFVITGYDAVAGLWNAMYDSSLISLLPSVIAKLPARGDFATAVVGQLTTAGVEQITGAAEGDTLSVDCADRQRLAGESDDDVIARDPQLTSFFSLTADDRCELWHVPSVDPSFNEAVRSDVPTLVLADEYDPITPPAQSKSAADALAHATFVLFPGLGHGAVFSGAPCPVAVFQSFLATPATADTTCVATMGPPKWAVG